MSETSTTSQEAAFETRELDSFDKVAPQLSDNLICGRGRITVEDLVSFLLTQLEARGVGALKVKIGGTSGYGYIVLESDEAGNISPTYYSQEEYDEINS